MKMFSVGAALAVLCFHTAVLAQQPAPPAGPAPAPAPPAPAPPPPAAPPAYPYGPPPGYGAPPAPPPPSYYYYPPPPPRGVWRPFTFSLGGGIGWLALPEDGDDRDTDPSFDYMARLGFGVTRNWVVFIGLDGAQVSTAAVDTTVTNYVIGAQFFFLQRFYARGGVGLATFSEEGPADNYSTAGQGFIASAGAELFQGENVAFGVEYSGALSRFSGGSYFKNGLLLALSFY